jgi:hypothetical protein
MGDVWEPVEDGNHVPTITDGEMWAYERDGKKGKAIVIRKDNFHGDLILEDGYAICRLAQAEAASSHAHSLERIAESLERALPVLAYIHVQLGNIHQTLITPDANREPVTMADQGKRIADALEELRAPRNPRDGKLGYGDLFGMVNLTPMLAPDPQNYKTEAAYLEAVDKFNDFRAQMDADRDRANEPNQ